MLNPGKGPDLASEGLVDLFGTESALRAVVRHRLNENYCGELREVCPWTVSFTSVKHRKLLESILSLVHLAHRIAHQSHCSSCLLHSRANISLAIETNRLNQLDYVDTQASN